MISKIDKLANAGLGRAKAFNAGRKDGFEDLDRNEWGDPKSSYFAFLTYHKKHNIYESWMDHKDDYVLGYRSTKPKL